MSTYRYTFKYTEGRSKKVKTEILREECFADAIKEFKLIHPTAKVISDNTDEYMGKDI